MNFNCIIKTGLVAVAAMVSLSSFSQDLIARQAPIDKKLKSVDSLALQKQIRAEQSEYPALSLYPNWNNQYAHSYGNAIIPETYTIDLTGFRMPTPSTKITSPFGPRWRRMHNGEIPQWRVLPRKIRFRPEGSGIPLHAGSCSPFYYRTPHRKFLKKVFLDYLVQMGQEKPQQLKCLPV